MAERIRRWPIGTVLPYPAGHTSEVLGYSVGGRHVKLGRRDPANQTVEWWFIRPVEHVEAALTEAGS